MIDRQHGQVVFVCDGAGEVLETGEADFGEALKAMRNEGWQPVRLKDGSWEHFCPDCREAEELS